MATGRRGLIGRLAGTRMGLGQQAKSASA